jgi:hypothetical protein
MIALLLGLIVTIWLLGFLLVFLCEEREHRGSLASRNRVPAPEERPMAGLPLQRVRVLADTAVFARMEEDSDGFR